MQKLRSLSGNLVSGNESEYPDEIGWSGVVPCSDGLLTIEEYCAMETVRTSRIFDDIARARSERPKRQTDKDQQQGGGDGAGEEDIEAALKAARTRVGCLRENHFRIAPRFD